MSNENLAASHKGTREVAGNWESPERNFPIGKGERGKVLFVTAVDQATLHESGDAGENGKSVKAGHNRSRALEKRAVQRKFAEFGGGRPERGGSNGQGRGPQSNGGGKKT